MIIILKTIAITCLIFFAGLFINVLYNYKKYKFLNKHPECIKKTINKHVNNDNTETYYTITVIGETKNVKYLSDIKWYNYDDVKFLYDHLCEIPHIQSDNNWGDDNKYYYVKLNVDGYILDINILNDNAKYTAILRDNIKTLKLGTYGYNTFKSLSEYCDKRKKILDRETFTTEVMLSNDDSTTKEIQKAAENAIASTDIKELKKIVQEYKDTVAVSNAITKVLMKTIKNDG